MSWDPTVLRKYNATGHFRLLNQLRGELKSNPLVRPKEGERIADVNRSRALVRAIEGASGSGRSRRTGSRLAPAATATEPLVAPSTPDSIAEDDAGSASFRERLSTIDWR